jgi:hypothetical protein
MISDQSLAKLSALAVRLGFSDGDKVDMADLASALLDRMDEAARYVPLVCYYDLAHNPPTYDFVTFLVRCEALRVDRSKEIVEIVILPGPVNGFRKDTTWPPRPDVRRELLRNIVIPMASLLPACRSIATMVDRPKGICGFGLDEYSIPCNFMVAGFARGFRPLRFPSPVARNNKLITITLREAEHHPQRNSRVKEWVSAATSLMAKGYSVIVLRDTARANERLGDGIITNPSASNNLMERARLYSSAALNMFVSNGCAWLAVAMDLPVIVIGSPAMAGVIPPNQIPGSPPYQRITWGAETADVIVGQALAFMESQT